MLAKCLNCGFFQNSPATIEAVFPGLNSLSSAYSSVRGEAGICDRLDLFVSQRYGCIFFEPALRAGQPGCLERGGRNAIFCLRARSPGGRSAWSAND